jgi:hypothetical protein
MDPWPADDPPCDCDPRFRRYCSEAVGLGEDLIRAARAGEPLPGTTNEIGGADFERSRERYRRHIQRALDYREANRQR